MFCEDNVGAAMAKPTFLQTVLGRPSQTYSLHSVTKDYHSSKHAMLRAAAAIPLTPPPIDLTESSDDDDDDFYTPNTSPNSSTELPMPPPRSSSPMSLRSTLDTASLSGHSLFEFSSASSTGVTTPRSSHSRHTYTDADWAKDVRWLVPPAARVKATITPISASNPRHYNKAAPSIMMNMSTLLEADEDPRQPQNSVSYDKPRLASSVDGHTRPSTHSHTDTPAHFRPNLPRRRSRSLTSPSVHPFDNYIPSLPSSTTQPLPGPSLPSNGTPGFTSLTLPRAPPPAIRPLARLASLRRRAPVDLTRSGAAQTTMATVEVVRGLGSTRTGFLSALLLRRLSTRRRRRGDEDERALAFTHHRTPPGDVPPTCVLVQVWAVALDGIDARLVDLKGGGDGSDVGDAKVETGFIPGRSFVGRVMECGWDEAGGAGLKKGEWVAGLAEVRKCGALAEFIVIDRRRVQRVPYPLMDGAGEHMGKDDRSNEGANGSADSRSNSQAGTSQSSASNDRRTSTRSTPLQRSDSASKSVHHEGLGPGPYPYPSRSAPPSRSSSMRKSALTPSTSTSSHTSSRPMYSSHSSQNPHVSASPLTLDELALLPLCGIPAYRAVQTFALAFAGEGGGTRRRRALVLRGHDGAGALAVQMLTRRGWRVCVHAPGADGDAGWDARDAYMHGVEARVRRWGAEEVVFDDGDADGGEGAVARAVAGLGADGDVFDAVLDAAGGRAVWAACVRVMRGGGQFTTLVGDVPGRVLPSARDHFRAGLRALQGGEGEKAKVKDKGVGGERGKGRVGYAWVSVEQDVDWEGEGVGESLGAVLRMALADEVRPWVEADGRAVMFERTPEVFVRGGRSVLDSGGAVVVRVVQ